MNDDVRVEVFPHDLVGWSIELRVEGYVFTTTHARRWRLTERAARRAGHRILQRYLRRCARRDLRDRDVENRTVIITADGKEL